MSSDIDADLFAFLYTIAAGVHTLQARTGPMAATSDPDATGDDRQKIHALPDLSRLSSVLDQVNERLDAAEARVLDLGQELAEHVPSVEAKRATHDAVRNLLDHLANVREAVEEFRSFDYREGPLQEFLVDQRRTLTKVRRTIDAMDASSLRASAARDMTLHRLRSGLPSSQSS